MKELLVQSAAALAIAQDSNNRLCNLGAIFIPAASHDAPVCTDTAEGELEALYLQQRATQGRINSVRPVVQGIRDARRGCVGREAASTAAVLKLIKVQLAKTKVAMQVTPDTTVADVVAFAKEHFRIGNDRVVTLAYGDNEMSPDTSTLIAHGVVNKAIVLAAARVPLTFVLVKRRQNAKQVEVGGDDTVAVLKASIFAAFDLPVGRQRLSYNRRAMADNGAQLADFGVEEGSTVTLTAVKAVAPTVASVLGASAFDVD